MTLSVHMQPDAPAADVVLIRCAGELDVGTAAKLIDAFDRAGLQRPKEVRVDLRDVEFIDSTGLGCLAHGALAFQKQAIGFEVLASAPVRDVIDKGGLKALLASRSASHQGG